ncbi:MAG TPA: diiron oxygenase [Planctomycetota bacterium]
MPKYSYARCLANAQKVNWRIEEVLGNRAFDPDRRWLPLRLSGAALVNVLDEEERRKLTQVEMASYAHLFGYVEEFIAPKVTELSRDFALEGRDAFDALTSFAAEEVKHMHLFRQLRARVDAALGFETGLIGDESATARYVLSKSSGAVLLLTACIEWLTQRHFTEAFAEDEGLDPFTKQVFRAHWQEESQHAQMDHLETLRAFARMDAAQREQAIDELIELVGAVDGLLQQQVALDIENLARHLGRAFEAGERADLEQGLLRAKRWTFLESGVTHPRFQELFAEVTTPEQQARVGAALNGLLEPAHA